MLTPPRGPTDLLGNQLTDDERELVALFNSLLALGQRDDLPPVVTANVKQALVMLWNVCNDLGLVGDEPGCD